MRSGAATKLTYDDYAAIDDGKRYELIEGELVLNPAPFLKHQRVSRALAMALVTHVEAHRLGEVLYVPVDVVLATDVVLQPDIIFVSKARAAIATAANVQGAPDLVVEIVSGGTRVRDENVKRGLYERYGVTEYWIADPEADSIRVLRRDGEKLVLIAQLYASNDDVLTTPLLPGLTVIPGDVFRLPEL